MVDLTRRKTVIGLGLLATGSGATFTSAAFSNSVNPASDMRVVVEEDNLVVEPGASFRDGSGNYDSTLDPTTGNFTGENNNDIFNSSNPTQGTSDELGGDVDLDDLPVAFVSNDTNGDLTIRVAVALGDKVTFEDMLRVDNNGTSSVEVGIKFSAFGVDTTSSNVGSGGDFSNKGGAVDIENAVGAYTFSAPDEISSSSDQISTDASDFAGQTDPTVNSQAIPSPALTVGSGNTESIDLTVDMTSGVSVGSDDLATQADTAASAANPGSNPFQEKEDTVQLVQEITIGTDASDETI